MKKFKFEYSTVTYILLVVVAIVSAIGGGWNIFNLIEFSYLGALKIVLYSVIVALCFFVCACAISIAVYGKYFFDKQKLVCQIGFIRTSIPLSDITKITHFRKSNKLVIYYNDKYSVVVINPSQYEDFILTLREHNSQIEYDVQTDGEDTPKN